MRCTCGTPWSGSGPTRSWATAPYPIYDGGLAWTPGPGSNSITVLVKHMAGNMRSRWTSFLTTAGEKPDRDRDAEFVVEPDVSREQVLEWWADGWARLFETLTSLTPTDLTRTVIIKGQPHSVLAAITSSWRTMPITWGK